MNKIIVCISIMFSQKYDYNVLSSYYSLKIQQRKQESVMETKRFAIRHDTHKN